MNALTNLRKAALFLTLGAATLTSCNKDDEGDPIPEPTPTPGNTDNIIVNQSINANTTWESGNVYQLAGRVTVESGATLTIEPGTIIKGEAGSGSNATALLIARGAKLMAEGTAEMPIIFTSVADEIKPSDIEAGNFGSPNLDPDVNGLWGGVIVLGNAPISASADEVQIEGIPTSDPNGLYGGNIQADNSGVLKYISIRHGGTNIGAGNEINGLTLGGVGSGTVVDHIEVVANQDDGIEWFGGTVNTSNVIVWNVGDDGIDTDQSWAGTLDNFIVIAATGHAFELDGPEGDMEAGHTIKNGSIVTTDDALGRVTEDLVNVDDNSIVTLDNLFFTGIVSGQQVSEDDDESLLNVLGVTFSNILLDVSQEEVENHVNGPVPDGIIAGSSSQADASVFGWTWASNSGALSGL